LILLEKNKEEKMKKLFTQLFLVISLCFLLYFSISCQNQEAMAELEKFKAQAEVEEQNKELIKRMYEAINKGDIEAYAEMLAPEYVWYMPSGNTKSISREGTIEFVREARNGFLDCHWSVEDLIAEGDIVLSRFIFSGTHIGEFQGIPATGNKVEMSGFMMTRIENGKCVEDKEEADTLGMMMQLGMELKPKEVEK